uniref:Zinc finger A20 and AN1 domain-containing stress-associated protein 9-like n=1 Tax=Populus alba TaxID=43335 RepID=A0A4U5Q790_POPAL|nr:zinc finger A20 and AN1 domain-containing stress-associated protein 9-like [Populus alba]
MAEIFEEEEFDKNRVHIVYGLSKDLSSRWKRSKKWTSIVVTPSFDDNNPDVVTDETTSTATAVASTSKVKNGCECCNKKVGLMGFECHCGSTFCGVHRYPKEHSCTFDFKTLLINKIWPSKIRLLQVINMVPEFE